MKVASTRSWAEGALFTGGQLHQDPLPLPQSHKGQQDKVGMYKISEQAILIILE